MDQEQVVFSIDDSPALQAQKRLDAGFATTEKNAKQLGDTIVSVFDRSKSALDRQLSSVSRMSQLYGKTGIDKLAAQYDIATKSALKYGATSADLDKVTAAFKRAKAAQEELDKASGANTGKTLFLGLKDLFEGRSAYALVEFGKTIGTLGAGLALMGGLAVAAFAGVGIASMKATESLASYGVEIQNVKLRTGLTTQEVAQFGFAAKATGQDISVYERGMRGLTTALEDNTSAGDKARKALKAIGVDAYDLNGNIKPTGELLQDLSRGLGSLPSVFERNKAGMDIFKRAWIEMSPAILELTNNLKTFRDAGLFAPTEEDKNKWLEYHRQIEIADGLWEKLGIKLKQGLAGTVWITVKQAGANALLDLVVGKAPSAQGNTVAPDNLFGGIDVGSASSRLAPGVPKPNDNDLVFNGLASSRMRRLAAGSGLEGARSAEEAAKKALDEARTDALRGSGNIDALHANMKSDAIIAAQADYNKSHSLVESFTKGPAQANELAEMAKGFAAAQEDPLTAARVKFADDVRKFQAMGRPSGQFAGVASAYSADVARIKAGMSGNFTSAMGSLAGLSENDKEFTTARNKQNDSAFSQLLGFGDDDVFNKSRLPFITPQLSSRDSFQNEALAEKRQEQMLGITAQPGDEVANMKKLSDMRVDLAIKEAKLKKDEIDAESLSAQQLANKQFDNAVELDRKLTDIKTENLESLAKLQKEQAENVAKTTEGLLHTLFTNPSGFGKQLGGTLRDAILKPIESGIADLVKTPINRVIHGTDGNGGISGMFHGLFQSIGGSSSSDPALSTATNTKDTVSRLDDVIALLEGATGSSILGGAPRPAVTSRAWGGGGGSMASRFGMGAPAMMAVMLGLGTGSPGVASSGPGSGPMGSVSESISFPGGSTEDLGGALSGGSMIDVGGGYGGGSGIGGLPVSAVRQYAQAIGMAGGGSVSSGGGRSPLQSLLASKGLKGLKAAFYNSSDIALGNGVVSNAAGIGAGVTASLGGGAIAQGIGKIAQFGSGFIASPAGGALGTSQLLAGIMGPPGGVNDPRGPKQTIQTVGGGALAGANVVGNSPMISNAMTNMGGVGGQLGGAMVGAGIGLMTNGFQRQGVSGTLESTAGGALAGFAIAGPIGAAVGAAVGLVTGIVGNFVTPWLMQVKNEVKKLYGLTLSDAYANQIGQIAKQTFGGSISAAIRSPQVQQMLSVYAAATGQKFLFSNQPRAAYLTETGGTLTQQATYVNGQAYSYAGGIPTYGGVQTSTLPQATLNLSTSESNGGGRYTGSAPATIQLDGPATTALLSGQIASSSQEVASAYSDAQNNSFDRRSNAARLLNPNLAFG